MNKQEIYIINNNDYKYIDSYLSNNNISKFMLVCGNSINKLKINKFFINLINSKKYDIIKFSEFTPNPKYESIVKGVNIFDKENCQAIIVVGGGSAIDVAKCIKLYSKLDISKSFFNQNIIDNNIKLLVIPTTSGSGSEATKYAVVYYNDEKMSITNDSIIPNAVLFDSSTLEQLPSYQKISSMLDALCHAIESYWSVNSTVESQEFSQKALNLIVNNIDGYLANDKTANSNMQLAAYTAGQAINITQTTAGHAMCYKLTTMYNIAHGHAAFLCVNSLFKYTYKNLNKCIDFRGSHYLSNIIFKISNALGFNSINSAIKFLSDLQMKLNLCVPEPKPDDYKILVNSVNLIRLKNNPIKLELNDINYLYHEILEGFNNEC